jgi:hypothetical protein
MARDVSAVIIAIFWASNGAAQPHEGFRILGFR